MKILDNPPMKKNPNVEKNQRKSKIRKIVRNIPGSRLIMKIRTISNSKLCSVNG
jgi:hypothetical protein